MINIGDHYNLWIRLLSLNVQTQKHMHALHYMTYEYILVTYMRHTHTHTHMRTCAHMLTHIHIPLMNLGGRTGAIAPSLQSQKYKRLNVLIYECTKTY